MNQECNHDYEYDAICLNCESQYSVCEDCDVILSFFTNNPCDLCKNFAKENSDEN